MRAIDGRGKKTTNSKLTIPSYFNIRAYLRNKKYFNILLTDYIFYDIIYLYDDKSHKSLSRGKFLINSYINKIKCGGSIEC